MLKLEPPKTQLRLDRGDTVGKRWERLQKRVREHPFNHAVEVFVPGLARLPSHLQSLATPVYSVSQLTLSVFTEPDLRPSLSSQSLCGLSIDSRIDTDCVYALLPSGKLVLSVDKDTYEQLGLVGRESRYQKRHRFIVEVELMADHFRPGKPNYERVRWSLGERLGESVRFALCHSPAVEGEVDKKLFVTSHSCTVDRNLLHNFELPTVDYNNPQGQTSTNPQGQTSTNPQGQTSTNPQRQTSTCCSVADIHTWLGAVACGIDVSGWDTPGNDYVSTYHTPEPHTLCQYGTRVRWSGMVHSDWIWDTLCRARGVLESDREADAVPWIAVSVWGFEDSPVSWGSCEHGSLLWGDNHYTVLLFRQGPQYWTVTSLGSHDTVC